MTMSTLSPNLDHLQKNLGVSFKDLGLLKNAFIHRSYLNEHKDFKGTSNERLEFLGDAVLSLVVSKFLYQKMQNSPEGKLTQTRSTLVRTETLGKLAQKLNLGKYLVLSKGEEESGGRTNIAILANTFEALVGAIYLDGEIEKAHEFIKNNILSTWQDLVQSAVTDNKSKLQEILQKKYRQSPIYKLLKTWGPDHNRTFEVGVYLDDKLLGKGSGKNKQAAAQNAAKVALSRLKNENLR